MVDNRLRKGPDHQYAVLISSFQQDHFSTTECILLKIYFPPEIKS